MLLHTLRLSGCTPTAPLPVRLPGRTLLSRGYTHRHTQSHVYTDTCVQGFRRAHGHTHSYPHSYTRRCKHTRTISLLPLANRPFLPAQTPGSGTVSWTRMTEGTAAFPALLRSGLASPEHPAVAPWGVLGATPVNCARWPTPVSPWVGGWGGHRQALPRTRGIVFAMGGSLRTREGEGVPWVTQHILGSSLPVPEGLLLPSLPAHSRCVPITPFLSQSANTEFLCALCKALGAQKRMNHSPAHCLSPINQWSLDCGRRAALRVCLRLSDGRGGEGGKGSLPGTKGLNEVLKDE